MFWLWCLKYIMWTFLALLLLHSQHLHAGYRCKILTRRYQFNLRSNITVHSTVQYSTVHTIISLIQIFSFFPLIQLLLFYPLFKHLFPSYFCYFLIICHEFWVLFNTEKVLQCNVYRAARFIYFCNLFHCSCLVPYITVCCECNLLHHILNRSHVYDQISWNSCVNIEYL